MGVGVEGIKPILARYVTSLVIYSYNSGYCELIISGGETNDLVTDGTWAQLIDFGTFNSRVFTNWASS